MSSNKIVHDQLAKIYGNKCMFLAIHKDDADFKRFVESKKYSSKELNRLIKNITVHHLKHRSEGGKTDVKNCSLINELAHRYLHSLPRQDEEVINNSIREYKDNARECKIQLVDDLDIDCSIKFAEISFTEEIRPPKEKFNRAKVKQETRNKIRDWEERKMITTETRYESYKEIKDKKKQRYNQILDRLDRPKTAKQIAVELFDFRTNTKYR